MAVQWSTTVRNARLDAIEVTIGTAAVLKFFTGAPPAACVTADSGTLLASITLASDWAADASGGSKNLNNLPLTITTSAGGNVGYYRMYASGGTCHEQGTVGLTGSGADLIVDNIAWATSQTVNVTVGSKTEPGA